MKGFVSSHALIGRLKARASPRALDDPALK